MPWCVGTLRTPCIPFEPCHGDTYRVGDTNDVTVHAYKSVYVPGCPIICFLDSSWERKNILSCYRSRTFNVTIILGMVLEKENVLMDNNLLS